MKLINGERYNHPHKSEVENDLLYEIRMDTLNIDSCFCWLFAVAEYLQSNGQEVPAEWEYQPSMFGFDFYGDEYQAIEEMAGDDYESVLSFGKTLNRWSDILLLDT